jgi:hypothetical protein
VDEVAWDRSSSVYFGFSLSLLYQSTHVPYSHFFHLSLTLYKIIPVHAVKVYGDKEVHIAPLISSEIGGEWSASCHDRSTLTYSSHTLSIGG